MSNLIGGTKKNEEEVENLLSYWDHHPVGDG